MRLHARQTEATPAPRVGDDGTTTLALLLAGLAGWVDAIGVGSSNDVFLSFMSGNTTNLALSLTHQDWARAKTIGAAVALFVAGVTFGELVRRWTGRLGQPLVLWLESFLLGAGAAFHWPGIGVQVSNTLWPLVFAMGLQNTSMRRVGGINVGLTYVTGALVQGRPRPRGPRRRHRDEIPRVMAEPGDRRGSRRDLPLDIRPRRSRRRRCGRRHARHHHGACPALNPRFFKPDRAPQDFVAIAQAWSCNSSPCAGSPANRSA